MAIDFALYIAAQVNAAIGTSWAVYNNTQTLID